MLMNVYVLMGAHESVYWVFEEKDNGEGEREDRKRTVPKRHEAIKTQPFKTQTIKTLFIFLYSFC